MKRDSKVPPTPASDKRDDLVQTITDKARSSDSPIPPANGDRALAEAISELAKEAGSAVTATEQATKDTRQMKWSLWAVLAIVLISNADQRRVANEINKRTISSHSMLEAGSERLDNMEGIMGQLAHGLEAETEAGLAEDLPQIDDLLAAAEEPEPEKKPEPGTVPLKLGLAKKIMAKQKSAAAPAHDMEVMKTRVRAQGHAISVQHAVSDAPEDKQEHAKRYEKLQKTAKRMKMKLPDLPPMEALK